MPIGAHTPFRPTAVTAPRVLHQSRRLPYQLSPLPIDPVTPPWEGGLGLPGIPVPTRTGQIPTWDPHELQRPRSYLETSTLQAARRQGCEWSTRDRESTPHTGASGSVTPRTHRVTSSSSKRACAMATRVRVMPGSGLIAQPTYKSRNTFTE